MDRKIELELPKKLHEDNKRNPIKELQNNIDMQLELIQDRIQQKTLIDLDDIKKILANTESIIYEIYATPKFNTSIYKNFSVLLYEYQRLSLRMESANVQDNIDELNKRIEKMSTDIDKSTKKSKKQMKSIQRVLKEITTTIVSIILAISIIPTAITVLQEIKPEFVLPIVSTVIFFGMSMILFVYLIHQVIINWKVLTIYFIIFIVTIILWCLPWHIKIEFIPKVYNNEIITNSGEMSLS